MSRHWLYAACLALVGAVSGLLIGDARGVGSKAGSLLAPADAEGSLFLPAVGARLGVSPDPIPRASPTPDVPPPTPTRAPGSTALGALAASMQRGEWAGLATRNISETLGASGSSGMIFGYTDSIKWDPLTHQLLYVGGDHGDAPVFVTYSDDSNTWRREPSEPWMVGTSHGYDHSALDPETGNFYHRPFNSREVFRYNTITRIWTPLPEIPEDVWDTVSCCVGMDFYSSVDGIVLASTASHGAIVWDERQQAWKGLTGPLAMGAYHNFAETNRNRHVLVFGGGNAPGSRSMYWLDADGFAAPLPDAPFDLGIQWGAVFTSDPVSGEYLVLARSGEMWSYDVTFETWRRLFETTPVTTTSYDNPIHGVVATPIGSYGVTLFVTCERSDCRVTLYKHVGE